MNITESDVATWLIDQARKGLTGTVDMGALEKIVEEVSRECRRQALETLVREMAAEQPRVCPTCGGKLNVEAYTVSAERRSIGLSQYGLFGAVVFKVAFARYLCVSLPFLPTHQSPCYHDNCKA